MSTNRTKENALKEALNIDNIDIGMINIIVQTDYKSKNNSVCYSIPISNYDYIIRYLSNKYNFSHYIPDKDAFKKIYSDDTEFNDSGVFMGVSGDSITTIRTTIVKSDGKHIIAVEVSSKDKHWKMRMECDNTDTIYPLDFTYYNRDDEAITEMDKFLEILQVVDETTENPEKLLRKFLS